MNHELKTHPPFFQAVLDGIKTFEARKNDRGFQAGDTLTLREYDPSASSMEGHKYTGRTIEADVTYVLQGSAFGIADGYCVMAIKTRKAREHG